MQRVGSVREMEQAVLAHDTLGILFSRQEREPSRAVTRGLRNLALRYPEIAWYHVNLDEIPAAASRYLVFDAPAVLVYHRGKPVIKHQNSIHVERLGEALEQLVGSRGRTEE